MSLHQIPSTRTDYVLAHGQTGTCGSIDCACLSAVTIDKLVTTTWIPEQSRRRPTRTEETR